MRVIVRYADGSMYDGEFDDAPAWSVQTVAYVDQVEGTPVLRHQGDYYYAARDGSIVACDAATVLCHMQNAGVRLAGNLAAVTQWAAANGYLIGSMLGQHEWREVYALGKQDTHRLI